VRKVELKDLVRARLLCDDELSERESSISCLDLVVNHFWLRFKLYFVLNQYELHDEHGLVVVASDLTHVVNELCLKLNRLSRWNY